MKNLGPWIYLVISCKIIQCMKWLLLNSARFVLFFKYSDPVAFFFGKKKKTQKDKKKKTLNRLVLKGFLSKYFLNISVFMLSAAYNPPQTHASHNFVRIGFNSMHSIFPAFYREREFHFIYQCWHQLFTDELVSKLTEVDGMHSTTQFSPAITTATGISPLFKFFFSLFFFYSILFVFYFTEFILLLETL